MSPRTRPPRLAVIDLGTNAVRLMVAEVEDSGKYRMLAQERRQTRLGEGLYEAGRLGVEPMRRSLEALGALKEIAASFEAEKLRVVATAAVREAANGDEFRAEARARHGLEVEVIDEDEEARLAFRSVTRNFPAAGDQKAIVDIGGGSLELVLASGGAIEEVRSLPLGAVRLTERLLHSDPVAPDEWEALLAMIDATIREVLPASGPTVPVMIGSGGTFTTLAAMSLGEHPGEAGAAGTLQGYELTRTDLGGLLDRLRHAPLAERRRIPGLPPERADIILAGAAVVDRLARRLGCTRILVNERGIRDGLLLEMIAARFPAA